MTSKRTSSIELCAPRHKRAQQRLSDEGLDNLQTVPPTAADDAQQDFAPVHAYAAGGGAGPAGPVKQTGGHERRSPTPFCDPGQQVAAPLQPQDPQSASVDTPGRLDACDLCDTSAAGNAADSLATSRSDMSQINRFKGAMPAEQQQQRDVSCPSTPQTAAQPGQHPGAAWWDTIGTGSAAAGGRRELGGGWFFDKLVFVEGHGLMPFVQQAQPPAAAAPPAVPVGGAPAYHNPQVVSAAAAPPQLGGVELPAPGAGSMAAADTAAPASAPAAAAAAMPAPAGVVRPSLFPSLSKIGSFKTLLQYMEVQAPCGGLAWQQREARLGSSWRSGKANGSRWTELKAAHAAIKKGSQDGGFSGLQLSAARLDGQRVGRPFAAFVKNGLNAVG